MAGFGALVAATACADDTKLVSPAVAPPPRAVGAAPASRHIDVVRLMEQFDVRNADELIPSVQALMAAQTAQAQGQPMQPMMMGGGNSGFGNGNMAGAGVQ